MGGILRNLSYTALTSSTFSLMMHSATMRRCTSMMVVHSSSPPSYAAWYTSTTVMSSSASYVLSGPSSVTAKMRPLTLESPANVAHITATCESISSQDDTSSDVI